MGGHFDLLQCSRNASSNAPMPPCSRTTTETSFWSKRYRLESASAADLRKPQLSPVPLTALTTAWMPPTLQSTAQEVLEVLEVLEVMEGMEVMEVMGVMEVLEVMEVMEKVYGVVKEVIGLAQRRIGEGRVTACYNASLRVTARSYVLPRAAPCYCALLHATARYHVLLRATARYYIYTTLCYSPGRARVGYDEVLAHARGGPRQVYPADHDQVDGHGVLRGDLGIVPLVHEDEHDVEDQGHEPRGGIFTGQISYFIVTIYGFG